MMFQGSNTWNERSKQQRATLVASLRLLMDDALRLSQVPFQLVQGARSIEQQQAYFDAGKSKINPKAYADRNKLYADAKHVTGPGMPLARAVDIVIDVKGKPYDTAHLCYVAGVVMCVARMRGMTIRWGGNFDRDGEILEQSFDDLPHFEVDA